MLCTFSPGVVRMPPRVDRVGWVELGFRRVEGAAVVDDLGGEGAGSSSKSLPYDESE
jgi:hypothetical protein